MTLTLVEEGLRRMKGCPQNIIRELSLLVGEQIRNQKPETRDHRFENYELAFKINIQIYFESGIYLVAWKAEFV